MKFRRAYFYIMTAYLLCGLLAWSPAQDEAEDSSPPVPSTFREYPGDLYFFNYKASPAVVRQQGMTLARVRNRVNLPGGPYAFSQIDDYVLENKESRLYVHREGRPGYGTMAQAGNIVDFVFRDQMWDQFGGIEQVVRVNGRTMKAKYNTIRMIQDKTGKKAPLISCFGVLDKNPNILVITVIMLEPDKNEVFMQTQVTNKTDEFLRMDCMDKVNWGALPFFIGGYGIQPFEKKADLMSHVVCGFLDDYSIGVVNQSSEPMEVLDIYGNECYLRYESPDEKAPGQSVTYTRRLVLGRKGMEEISQRCMEIKDFDYGWVQGQVKEKKSGEVAPFARVGIGRVDRRATGNEKRTHAHTVVRADEEGRFRCALPVGKYYIQTRAKGRIVFPPVLVPFNIQKGQVTVENPNQVEPSYGIFQVVDADTGEAVPARLRIMPSSESKYVDLGQPWNADGARNTVWMKPGENKVPMTPGKYTCMFSRGPEYEVVEKELILDALKTKNMKIQLKRVVPTKGMIAMDFNLATKRSPSSRVSAEDLVLAAAGEGLEWIVSGDLNHVTDLQKAIASQDLGKWIKASAGVHLSYQYPKLFGEFYVFPVPADTPAQTLAGLADFNTSPAEFFANVRKTFPDAIITVMKPMQSNASYLAYYGMDLYNGLLPVADDFSMDFDAVACFEGKSDIVSRNAWNLLTNLYLKGYPKLPLASSRAASLAYEEPGYPRTYVTLKNGKDNISDITEADWLEAFKNRHYQMTNGPISKVTIDGKYPVPDMYHSKDGRMEVDLEIYAAPWVPFTGFSLKGNNKQARYFRTQPTEDILRFSTLEGENSATKWKVYEINEDTGQKEYEDVFISLEATTLPLDPVVSQLGAEKPFGLSVTAPILIDADGNGEFKPGSN
ncbi:MAG: hypothetical protein ACOC54_00390 [Candidatus Sumerlaeota bacterium]